MKKNGIHRRNASIGTGFSAEYNQLSDPLRSLHPSEVRRSIGGGSRAQITHCIDAHFSAFALAIARRIEINVEFGSGNTDLPPA
jgi:hypothetical protein